MICFKDKTFCSASHKRCVNDNCHRYFSENEQAQARAWFGSDHAPVAFADFSVGCADIIAPPPPEDVKDNP